MSPDEGRAEGDRAMEALRRAVAAGWGDLAKVRTDPELDTLRPRSEFQLLILDIAFPVEPFRR
jgi:eukaryotic-like serine/threonine-protein kinase